MGRTLPAITGPRPAQNQCDLDEADLKLIDLLDADPRITYTEVAARLKVGRATAKAMVDRLYKRGARTVCYVDEWVRGYVRSVAFFINTEPAALFEVANGLAAMEEVQSVVIFSGPFDIMATAVFKAQKEIPRFVSDRLGTLRGIVRHESSVYYEIKPGHGTRSDKAQSNGEAALPDDLDLALIRELEKNARESATALAARLRTTRTTVVRRLNRLIERRIVFFQTLWGSAVWARKGVALAGMKVSAPRIRDVAQALAGHEQVRGVLVCTGRYDVVCWVTFDTQENLVDFLGSEVGRIPGIAGMESAIGLKLVKYDLGPAVFNWPDRMAAGPAKHG